jgi:hypothetical protein
MAMASNQKGNIYFSMEKGVKTMNCLQVIFVHKRKIPAIENGDLLVIRYRIYTQRSVGIINVRFDVMDQLLIRSSAFVRYGGKIGSTGRQYISYS